jgi:hypothetical protein
MIDMMVVDRIEWSFLFSKLVLQSLIDKIDMLVDMMVGMIELLFLAFVLKLAVESLFDMFDMMVVDRIEWLFQISKLELQLLFGMIDMMAVDMIE